VTKENVFNDLIEERVLVDQRSGTIRNDFSNGTNTVKLVLSLEGGADGKFTKEFTNRSSRADFLQLVNEEYTHEPSLMCPALSK
jgi:hypothetical protein